MFTEDYLMRMINLALSALLTAIGLKKAGKYQEARQAIDQAVEGLTAMPANLLDQMDDDSLLSLLTVQDKLDVGRLAVLADLYHEQGEIQLQLGQAAQGASASARALRLILEAVLAGQGDLFPELIGKIEARRQAVQKNELPVQTQLALLDYFQRLLAQDNRSLAAAGTGRERIADALAKLQAQLGPDLKPTDG
jgi:hypothetical protein